MPEPTVAVPAGLWQRIVDHLTRAPYCDMTPTVRGDETPQWWADYWRRACDTTREQAGRLRADARRVADGTPVVGVAPAVRPPRRIIVRCPRCEADIELGLAVDVRLTYTAGSGDKGWITADAGVTAIEHRCEVPRG